MHDNQNFGLTDSEFQRLKQGDQRLQTRVFDKYAPQFVQLVRTQFSLSVEDAEEIVSGAFAKLFYKILQDAVALDNLQGYVFTIVKHKSYEKMAQNKRGIVENRAEMPEIADEDDNSEWLNWLNLAFNKLGEGCQKLLSCFYWDGKDHREIAQEYRITEDASRQRKRECMKKLKMIVAEMNPSVIKNSEL